jgi:two-component system, chemotaxis family, chemotaxis protein CheY
MSLGRILVVDDQEEIRRSVRLTLTKAGYDVIDAEDGEKGIQQMRSGDNPLMVDAILCDIHMPNLNGVEAIAFFRQQCPSVPVIVMTGRPEITGATDLMRQGVVDYLIKPVRPDELTKAVSKYARRHD